MNDKREPLYDDVPDAIFAVKPQGAVVLWFYLRDRLRCGDRLSSLTCERVADALVCNLQDVRRWMRRLEREGWLDKWLQAERQDAESESLAA
jgi:hypothetical protein